MSIFHIGILLLTVVTVCNGRCPIAPITSLNTSRTNVKIDHTYSLPALAQETGYVESGESVPTRCHAGFVLTAGQLNITCVGGNWTAFPICIPSSFRDSRAAPVLTANDALPCTIDTSSTYTLTNGYPTNMTLIYITSNTATGSVVFACYSGYALDPTIGGSYVCNNGVWSTKPQCLITGRCLLSALQSFLNISPASQTIVQSYLAQDSQNSSLIITGAFLVVNCASGYTNIGGSLNITCSSTSAWSPFPTCMSGSGSGSITTTTMATAGGAMTTTTMATAAGAMTTTTIATAGGAPCTIDPSSSFLLTNGYSASVSVVYITSTTVTGSAVFACYSGYALDPTIGASYMCNNGVWSTKPRCLITGRCLLSALQSFLNSASASQTIAQSYLAQDSQNSSLVISGAYLAVTCISGYINIGGSLNITCSSTNSWSPFPNCVSGTGSGSITTTTTATSSGAACSINSTSFTLNNGFINSSLITYITPNTTTGSIVFACNTGYHIEASIGASYICNNGVWSTKPRCLRTGRCILSTLQSFITSSPGTQVTNQSYLAIDVHNSSLTINGSYLVVTCASGYTNVGGSLNITCLSNSSWSAFPNCVSGSGSGSITTTTMATAGGAMTTTTMATAAGAMTTTTMATAGGAPCTIDPSSSFLLTNGYSASVSVAYISSITVTGSAVFACYSGYALDPTIGASYVCNNGVWSTKPACLITGRCLLSALQSFLNSASGSQTIAQTYLAQDSQNSSLVISGAYLAVTCVSGYINIGGSLNITCSSTSSWSPLPNCVAGTQTTTTASASNGGSPCSFDSSLIMLTNGNVDYTSGLRMLNSTYASSGSFINYVCTSPYVLVGNAQVICTNGLFTAKPTCSASGQTTTAVAQTSTNCVSVPVVANGYISLAQLNQNTNSYVSVQFMCNSGYMLASTSGPATVTCNNGVWSSLPVCTASPVCSFALLQSAFVNMNIASKSLNSANGGILTGGWIVVQCYPPFSKTASSGDLNITCLSTGTWTQFPVCS